MLRRPRYSNTAFIALLVVIFVLISLQRDHVRRTVDSKQVNSFFPQSRSSNRNDTEKRTAAIRQDSSVAPFAPIQILEQYISQHSQEQLQFEFENDTFAVTERSFSVAYYSCPNRAGNILHSYLNTIVWGIIHNRTTLWKYHNTSNQEEDCSVVLQRAQWLPSFDEWKHKLRLPDPIPVSIEAGASSHIDVMVVLYPQIPDIRFKDSAVSRNSWSEHPQKSERYRKYIAELPSPNQKLAERLYSQGKEFLYGMLYSELFKLREILPEKIAGNQLSNLMDNSFSIALHSRHTVGADDGSFVPHERECLEKLLVSNHGKSPCLVYLMSDRPMTIHLLKEYLIGNHNCTVVTANHARGQGGTNEHGPWAGAGFLEDLEVSARAQFGVVGDPRRSSTALLIDLISYRRKIRFVANDGNVSDDLTMKDLRVCKLPDKALSGYSYGPGTPTFRNHKFLEPLPPFQILQSYLNNEETVDTIEVKVNLEQPPVQDIGNVLNSFLYGLLTNRSLALRVGRESGQDSECVRPGGLQMKEWLTAHAKKSMQGKQNVSSLPYGNLDLLRYGSDDWVRYLESTGELSDVQMEVLNTLYSYGDEIVYGFVFHELFSPCIDHISSPKSRYQYILELGQSLPEEPQDIAECMQDMIPEQDWLILEEIPEFSCHLYIVSDTKSIRETKVAVFLDEFETNLEFTLRGTERTCTFSFFSTEDFTDDLGNPSIHFWRFVEEASNTRTGWIRSKRKSSFSNSLAGGSMTNHALLMARERMEYKRHLETWKLGRDPFVISSFPECQC